MASESSRRISTGAAGEGISGEFKTLVNVEDLDSIKQTQNIILGRLQDSNAVLSHFNDYSENCFADVSADFANNARLLRSMKSDLDYVFLKLRSMKGKIMATYPDAFPDNSTIKALDQRPDLELPRVACGFQLRGKNSVHFKLSASANTADTLVDDVVSEIQLPSYESWSVHKFGAVFASSLVDTEYCEYYH